MDDLTRLHGKEFKVFVSKSNETLNMDKLPPASIIFNQTKSNGKDVVDMIVTDDMGTGMSLLPFLSVNDDMFAVDNRTLSIKDMSAVWPDAAAVIEHIAADFYTVDNQVKLDDDYLHITKPIVFANADDSDGIRENLQTRSGQHLECKNNV